MQAVCAYIWYAPWSLLAVAYAARIGGELKHKSLDMCSIQVCADI